MKRRNIGLILSYLNTGLNMLCGLFLSSYLLRSLGSTDYGIYQMIASFANYLVLLEFGTGTVMTRNIVAARTKSEDSESIDKNYSTIVLISIILSVAILLVSFIFYCNIGNIYSKTLTQEQTAYGKKIFIFITIYLLASFFSQTMNGLALAFEDYIIIPLISIVRIVVRTGLLVVLVFFYKYSIIIAIVDAGIGLIIGISMVIYCKFKFFVKFKFTYFDKGILKNSMPLCIAIFLQTIVNQANSNVDKFLIGIKLNPESVTLYSVALYIYSIFSSLTTLPITMYAPQVIKSVNLGNTQDELYKELVPPSRMIVVIGGLCLFGFIACGKQFVTIVYGTEYLQAWLIAIIIMVPMFLNMSNGILINVLDATNKRMFRSAALTITTIANIVLTVFWLDWWGIIGAAVATALCVFLGQITLMNIYYSKSLKINVLRMYRLTFKGILIFHIIGALLGYIAAYFIHNNWLGFFVGGCTYAIVFFLGYILFGMTEREKGFFKKLIRKK